MRWSGAFVSYPMHRPLAGEAQGWFSQGSGGLAPIIHGVAFRGVGWVVGVVLCEVGWRCRGWCSRRVVSEPILVVGDVFGCPSSSMAGFWVNAAGGQVSAAIAR